MTSVVKTLYISSSNREEHENTWEFDVNLQHSLPYEQLKLTYYNIANPNNEDIFICINGYDGGLNVGRRAYTFLVGGNDICYLGNKKHGGNIKVNLIDKNGKPFVSGDWSMELQFLI